MKSKLELCLGGIEYIITMIGESDASSEHKLNILFQLSCLRVELTECLENTNKMIDFLQIEDESGNEN